MRRGRRAAASTAGGHDRLGATGRRGRRSPLRSRRPRERPCGGRRAAGRRPERARAPRPRRTLLPRARAAWNNDSSRVKRLLRSAVTLDAPATRLRHTALTYEAAVNAVAYDQTRSFATSAAGTPREPTRGFHVSAGGRGHPSSL